MRQSVLNCTEVQADLPPPHSQAPSHPPAPVYYAVGEGQVLDCGPNGVAGLDRNGDPRLPAQRSNTRLIRGPGVARRSEL